MPIAQAGLAFRATAPIADFAPVVARLFGERATELSAPVPARFDIRNRSDVIVQVFADTCFIGSDALVRNLLREPQADATRLHAVLGAPPLLMAYCSDEAGGSHGYALFEHGRRLRTRLQTRGRADVPALAEWGPPQPFERRWRERDGALPPGQLTGRMLQDGLETLFGLCPWETLITPTWRFFRLGDACAPLARAPQRRAEPPKRPWWRFGRETPAAG